MLAGVGPGNGLGIGGGPGLGAGGAGTNVVPLVRVNPEYPLQARARGIEGYVEVEFTITTAGTVKDARIVDARPGEIFNRVALGAIRKWKYKPSTAGGIPVERQRVRVRLKFVLQG